MDEPQFRRGEIDITYLERVGAGLLASGPPEDVTKAVAIAAAILADQRRGAAAPTPSAGTGDAKASTWTETGRREALR
jgi:hypothetical protein